jgi:hypothetical protein
MRTAGSVLGGASLSYLSEVFTELSVDLFLVALDTKDLLGDFVGGNTLGVLHSESLEIHSRLDCEELKDSDLVTGDSCTAHAYLLDSGIQFVAESDFDLFDRDNPFLDSAGELVRLESIHEIDQIGSHLVHFLLGISSHAAFSPSS